MLATSHTLFYRYVLKLLEREHIVGLYEICVGDYMLMLNYGREPIEIDCFFLNVTVNIHAVMDV